MCWGSMELTKTSIIKKNVLRSFIQISGVSICRIFIVVVFISLFVIVAGDDGNGGGNSEQEY